MQPFKLFKYSSIFICSMAVSLFFQQCEEKEASPRQESTNPLIEFNQLPKSWKISRIAINGTVQALDHCQESSEITFSEDGKGTINYLASNCGELEKFTWEISPDTLHLSLASQEKQYLLIQALNSTICKYTITYPKDLTYEFTLTAQN